MFEDKVWHLGPTLNIYEGKGNISGQTLLIFTKLKKEKFDTY